MTLEEALKKLEEMFLKMELQELTQSRIKLAHLDAKLVAQINKLQRASQQTKN